MKTTTPHYTITTPDDPYAALISAIIEREFPRATSKGGAGLVDLVSAEILGTGQVRYGPKPSIENQAVIRAIIRNRTDLGVPIPFLLPWGSEKPDGGGVDLAELAALKTLDCLQKRVAAHYTPGLEFVIRLQDASAAHLFFERADEARRQAAHYCRTLEDLIYVLGLPAATTYRESAQFTEAEFAAAADPIVPVMQDYLQAMTSRMMGESVDEDGAFAALEALGWKGRMEEQVFKHYNRIYEHAYPDRDPAFRLHVLARYLSAALAVKKMDKKGDKPEWDGQFLELSFMEPVPGTEDKFPRRINYRTMPSALTSRHMAPWRAKGFARFDGEAFRIGLASFRQPAAYNRFTINLERDGRTADVRSDYVIDATEP